MCIYLYQLLQYFITFVTLLLDQPLYIVLEFERKKVLPKIELLSTNLHRSTPAVSFIFTFMTILLDQHIELILLRKIDILRINCFV